MKQQSVFIAFPCLCLLAACGGSNSNLDVNNITPQFSAYPASSYSIGGTTQDNRPIRGMVIQQKDELTASTGSGINYLVIKGKEYNLDKQKHVKALSFTRFGYFDNGKDDLNFYQGIPSDNVPITGKASYTGTAVQTVNGYDTPFDMKSHFDVDFGAHKLTGKIEGHGMTINLSAKIKGSDFSGQSVYKNEKGNVIGGFLGDNASEIAGVYHVSHTANGSFGAIKNK